MVVSAGGEVVDVGVVDVVVDVIPGDVVLDDRDDVRASSDRAPALHAVPTRARLAIRPQNLSTRRGSAGDALGASCAAGTALAEVDEQVQ